MAVVELVLLAVVSCSTGAPVKAPAPDQCYKIVTLPGHHPRIQPNLSVCLKRSKFIYANPPYIGAISFCRKTIKADGPKENPEAP